MAWLGEELPEKEQDGHTPFSPRCLKDMVEERLFAHRRGPVHAARSGVHGYDSLYFEGAGGKSLGHHGYSKDHRPDLRQIILALLLDGDGRPVCSGDVAGQYRRRDDADPGDRPARAGASILRGCCVVADRGMISAETMAELEARRLLYILGVRERTDKLVRDLVLEDRAPFVPLTMKKRAQGGRLRGQDGHAGRTPLHCLPQPSKGTEGCRRSNEAKPALVNHYRGLDPCNCFNPGIGRTTKLMHWRGSALRSN